MYGPCQLEINAATVSRDFAQPGVFEGLKAGT
jgi:hypothetical protein